MRTLSRTPRSRRARRLVTTAAVSLLAPLLAFPPGAASAAPLAPEPRRISYREWTSTPAFDRGRYVGTGSTDGKLRITRPVATVRYADPHGYRPRTYDVGRWVSPWSSPGYSFTELVASWDAETPRDSFVTVQVRGRSESGRLSKWYTMAHWAAGDAKVHRTSLGPQTDTLATVDTDVLRTRYTMGFTHWQMRLSLLRRTGTVATPVVDTVGAMTSRLPVVTRVATSEPGVARGITLDVPRYSQMIHTGDYPEYDAGGEAWCSPTSVSMVLGYHGALPRPREYAWVEYPHPQRFVDHAARMTYDYEYDGTGNWSFGTAYAAGHAGAGFVTRLRNLREAERFIRAGLPLVASVRYRAGELTGSPLRATDGHLLVIAGFTAGGDVVVNDPAARYNAGVRRVYDRGEFENAWIPESGGLVYVIRPDGRALPTNRSGNW